ncbi:MAG: glycosyltransferase family 39 protein [Dokdonella sp.]
MLPMSPTGEPNRWMAASLIALLIVGAILLVGWPAIHGFWVRDDLTQLAYVRLLGTPWPLFTHDHFPVPGSIFRPLGFASLWLSEWVFSHDYAANSIADLVLHGVLVFSLYRLMRVAVRPMTAFVSCLLFALPPVVLVTVMSWSNRFDLLAVLFTLVTLRALCDWIASKRELHLAVALVTMLAALLSKESGVIAVVGAALLIGEAALAHRIVWQRAMVGIVAVGLVGIVYVVWRHDMLGSGGNVISGLGSLIETLTRGTALWWRQLGGYLAAGLSTWIVVFALLVAVVAVIACVIRSDRELRAEELRRPILLAAIAFLFLPGVLQAPIAVLNSIAASADMSAVELGMQARLYYTGCVGLAMLLALLVDSSGRTPRRIINVGLFVLAAVAGVATHRIAASHAQRSTAIAKQPVAVVDYVASHPLPAERCRVVILGYQPAPEWATVTPLDSVIKALAPDLDKVSDCLFANEHHTYIHQFAADRVTPADLLPWRPRVIRDQLVPWLEIGGLVVAYLDPPSEFSTFDRDEILFLAIDGDSVTDVSAAVRDGTRVVNLQ